MKSGLTSVVIVLAFVISPDVALSESTCSTYDFSFHVEPAFLPDSTIEIKTRPDSAELRVNYRVGRAGVVRTERFQVDRVAAESFCSRMHDLMLVEQEKDDRALLDGISVNGFFRGATFPDYDFAFRSPNWYQHPRDHGIAVAVFTLLESAVPTCELNNYLERLATYFDFGLPARVVPGSPFTIRFYGGLSFYHGPALKRLFLSIPSDVPLRFDFSNFNSMATLLYPEFERLLTDRPAITWIASTEAAKHLAAMGVSAAHIEITEGPNLCGTLRQTPFRRH